MFPGVILPAATSALALRRRLLSRTDGVMVWYPGLQVLSVTSARDQRVYTRWVTSTEGMIAVRAWISPLPPPSEEMIRSFLTGR